MSEFAYQVKIPKERLAVLIGKNGEIKKKLESETGTKIEIDSQDGDVTVSGEDALALYSTRDIIKAIGRGFNPELAFLLLKQDYAFEMVNLPDFEKPTQFMRIKGRIIGKEGKSRRLIEDYTGTYVSVYGKTVGIIGRTDTIHLARKAIEMLIKGSPHSNVYKWLEKMKREVIRREYEENFDDYLKDDDNSKEESDSLKKNSEESEDESLLDE